MSLLATRCELIGSAFKLLRLDILEFGVLLRLNFANLIAYTDVDTIKLTTNIVTFFNNKKIKGKKNQHTTKP